MSDDEEEEKTRLIRRKTPPELPAVAAAAAAAASAPPPVPDRPTRMIEAEDGEGEMTRIVGPSRRSGGGASASASPSEGGGQPGDGGALDPVVGWLVVLTGPGRGNARQLGYGQNSLGRERNERVSLDFGDGSISRSKHCFVIYEPRKREYFIRPGEGSNLTYVNGDVLAEARPLAATDVIEIGATKLKFVPLCGPEFDWEDQARATA